MCSVMDLLEEPDVAVGIAELDVRAVVASFGVESRSLAVLSKVEEVADLDAPLLEILTNGLDVGDHQVQPPYGSGTGLGNPHPESDRARRTGRRELHDPEALARLVVDVQPEPGPLVELFG